MLCVLEVLSLVYGIMTLVRGRFNLGKTKEVRGAPAYLIGVALLSVLPIAVVAAIILNFDDLMKGNQAGINNFGARTVLPDVIGVAVGWGTALVIAFAKAKPKVDERRFVADDEYDDYDDRPRRRRKGASDDKVDRRRRDEAEDEDQDRVRGRRYDDDDRPRRRRYDEDDERPRRRDDLDDRAR